MNKRNNNKKKKEKKVNVLTCLIPGLKEIMDIPFPDRKLPVCEKCKKIYKTRRLCRERDGHTTFPWNKTYICFVLDDSCFTADDEGEEHLVTDDGPNPYKFIAKSEDCSPTMYYARFEGRKDDQLDPICKPCKVKNYTKNHCRIKHRHNHLPWNTVYMKFFAEKVGIDDKTISYQTGSKRQADCLSTLDSSLRKRTRSDDSSCARSSSDTNSVSGDSFVSGNRNDSKAFLLTLSNNKYQFQVSNTFIAMILTFDQ